MRIKEFSIRWYGPLKDTGRVALHNFSLLFGKNEYGKTLTIDAFAKFLFQRGRQLFSRINRVEPDPDGYLIIEDDNGKEVKLPDEGDLASITGLTPEECRNIFIVRNSDLSIALESEFYKNVTDRLTGLKTQEISRIKGELAELGKLTSAKSTASLRDWANEKLNTRRRSAQELIQKVQDLQQTLREEEFDRLEESILNVREMIGKTRFELENLEDARKREEYEKGNAAYEALIHAHQELREVEVYSDEDVSRWQSCETNIKHWEKEKEELREKVKRKKEEFAQKSESLNEQKLQFEVLSNRKKRIENELAPETKTYEMSLGKVKSGERRNKFFIIAAITSAALLLVSTLGLILNPAPIFYGLFAFFLAATVVFAALSFSFAREKAHLDAVFERIKLAASSFELSGESIEDILSNIRKFDEEYSMRSSELDAADRTVSSLDAEIKHLTETDMADLEKKISEAAATIREMVEKSGITTLQEYKEKLKLKQEYENSVETQRQILESHFGSKGEKWADNLSYWGEEISALKEFEHEAVGITYDARAVSQLKTDLQKFLSDEQELEQKASQFYEQLRGIERKANEILQLRDDYLYCATSIDLQRTKDKLSEFVAGIEAEKTNALTAIRLFERLEQKEEQKISELFGRDSLVSKYFRDITGGIYVGVNFVLDDTKEVRVTLQDGSTLAADKLSGGAYDQLYLSIRLALGQKLLKGSQGFFIMDDPFIKADEERLERQLNIVKKICEAGWQIIYFTAKDEVVRLLESDIDRGRVRYITLEGIFA